MTLRPYGKGLYNSETNVATSVLCVKSLTEDDCFRNCASGSKWTNAQTCAIFVYLYLCLIAYVFCR